MKGPGLLGVLLLSVALQSVVSSEATGQRKRSAARPRSSTSSLELRLRALEQRVLVLETLLSVRSGPGDQAAEMPAKTIEQWNLHVDAAQRRLEHSRRMARKGYITKFALYQDQLAEMWARQQLALAKKETEQAERIALEIDVVEAERDLAAAKGDVTLSRATTRYGVSALGSYASQLDRLQQAVEEATARLERARAKLNEHSPQNDPPKPE